MICSRCKREVVEWDGKCSYCGKTFKHIKKIERFKMAGAGRRLKSFIIDAIFFIILSILIGIIASSIGGTGGVIALQGITILTVVGYFTYFFGNGQTPGMKIMKIKLCGKDGTYPIGYSKGLTRFVGMMIFGSIFFACYYWILFDKNKQGLHDIIAGTYVIEA